jgi:hypothetical protein
MIAERSERETRRLRRIAERFEREGFRVMIEPSSSALPEWLSSFLPDLVATRGSEGVVVEVKSREEVHGDKNIGRLAEIVDGHPEWRFELDISNPREPTTPKPPAWPAASESHIQEQLQAASQLMQSGLQGPALLSAWAGFEGAARQAVARHEVELTPMPSASLLKTLWSLGYLDPESRDKLTDLGATRNRVAHGADPFQLVKSADISILLEVATQLLSTD